MNIKGKKYHILEVDCDSDKNIIKVNKPLAKKGSKKSQELITNIFPRTCFHTLHLDVYLYMHIFFFQLQKNHYQT